MHSHNTLKIPFQPASFLKHPNTGGMIQPAPALPPFSLCALPLKILSRPLQTSLGLSSGPCQLWLQTWDQSNKPNHVTCCVAALHFLTFHFPDYPPQTPQGPLAQLSFSGIPGQWAHTGPWERVSAWREGGNVWKEQWRKRTEEKKGCAQICW